MNEMTVWQEVAEGAAFLSMTPDAANRRIVANALMGADHKVGEMINNNISMTDLYVEKVTFTDEETGAIRSANRVIIFDKNGVSYETCSQGIFNSLKRICSIYGMPHWDEPVTVQVKQVSRNNRNILTLRII